MLDPMAQEAVMKGCERLENPRHDRFVQEYLKDFDRQGAEQRSGCSSGVLNREDVRDAVRRGQQQYQERCELTGDYVRQYIQDVLELCPTDYFVMASNGDWCIDPEQFRKLPVHVKRLVEGVERVRQGGDVYFRVRFISKTAALALAARFTMVQKVAAAPVSIPWDQIAGAVSSEEDTVEQRLQQLERAPV